MAKFLVVNNTTGKKLKKTNRKKVGSIVNALRVQFPDSDIMAIDLRRI